MVFRLSLMALGAPSLSGRTLRDGALSGTLEVAHDLPAGDPAAEFRLFPASGMDVVVDHVVAESLAQNR